jgi:hypothetical protein
MPCSVPNSNVMTGISVFRNTGGICFGISRGATADTRDWKRDT